MDKNKISIIIPVYNAEEYLDRCLKSVLDQGFASYEVILVDDGSTDSSALICDRYSATDSRFRTIHKPNGGVSSARNAGLALAKGEYVMFLDSDDALCPNALDLMTDQLKGEDLVIGGFVEYISAIPHRTEVPRFAESYSKSQIQDFFEAELRRNCVLLDSPWAKLYKRKSLGELTFCENLSYAEDKLFVFNFLARCNSIRSVDSPVYQYILRAGSLGSDIRSDRHLEQMRVFLPLYKEVLCRLSNCCPESDKVAKLYRNDLIGRYICRILNIFTTRKTNLLTTDYISGLYELMSYDKDIGVFSLRPGQVFNLLLYKIGKPGFSVGVYKVSAYILSLFVKS